MAKGATLGNRRRGRRRRHQKPSGMPLPEHTWREELASSPRWVVWFWSGNARRALLALIFLSISVWILRAAWAVPGEPAYERKADGFVGAAVLLIPAFGAQLVQSVVDGVRGQLAPPVFTTIGRWTERHIGVPGMLALMVAISGLWIVFGH